MREESPSSVKVHMLGLLPRRKEGLIKRDPMPDPCHLFASSQGDFLALSHSFNYD